ncbi:MAG: oligosaccharide flippase family protein [Oscillospiraceae bacterium]|nr:oligosaccharide flippase family protein [Oscillospiraceae bacterium]
MGKQSSGKKVILNAVIYSCSGLLLKCVSFFLLPLYTIYLTTEDYGITSIVGTFNGTMCYVVSFSLFSAVTRFYVELKEDPEKLKRFYGTICTFVFLSGLTFGGLFTIFRGALSKYVFSGLDFYPVILICIISLIFNCEYTIYDMILKSQQKAMKSSIISIVFFFISLALNILFIVVLQMGATGSLLATLISYVLYTAYFLTEMSLQKTIHFCIDWGLLKDALKYSIPIMPHNLSTHLALLISKIMIGGTASLSGLGVYTVAAQFGNVADTIQGYVSRAYSPWLFENLHDREGYYKARIRKITNLMSSVVGLFMLGIALFAQDYIVLFVDAAYIDAWRYVPLIVINYIIKIAYYFYVQILFYYKKASKMLFIATVSGSLINIVLSYFMIPAWGVYGSIIADWIAMIIRVGIVIGVSKMFEDVGLRVWDTVKNMLFIGVFVLGGMVFSYLKFGNTFSIGNFVYKIVVVLVYVAVLFARYHKELLEYIRGIKKGRSRKEQLQ